MLRHPDVQRGIPTSLPLLRRLTGLYRDADTTFLIVDDESPDGTARLVREFAAADDRVPPPGRPPGADSDRPTCGA